MQLVVVDFHSRGAEAILVKPHITRVGLHTIAAWHTATTLYWVTTLVEVARQATPSSLVVTGQAVPS